MLYNGGNVTECLLRCFSAALQSVRLPGVLVKSNFEGELIPRSGGASLIDLEISQEDKDKKSLDVSLIPEFHCVFKVSA